MCKCGNKKDLCLGIPLTQRKVLALWLFFFAASKSLKVSYSNFVLLFSLSLYLVSYTYIFEWFGCVNSNIKLLVSNCPTLVPCRYHLLIQTHIAMKMEIDREQPKRINTEITDTKILVSFTEPKFKIAQNKGYPCLVYFFNFIVFSRDNLKKNQIWKKIEN